jgi:hypothetical protein
MLFQVVSIQPSERWTCAMRNSLAIEESPMPLTRAQALPGPEILGRDVDRALDYPNQVGVRARQPTMRQLAET